MRTTHLVLATVTTMTLTACTVPAQDQQTDLPRSGRVVRVVDGDTLVLSTQSGRRIVRLIGVDAPEIPHKGTKTAKDTPECGGMAATSSLKRLVHSGTQVKIDYDTKADKVDRYGRLLAVITPEGSQTSVNLTQVSTGMAGAWQPKSAPKAAIMNDLWSAQVKARATRTGSWATCDHLGRE